MKLWTGRILTTIAALFMAMDGIFKFTHAPQIIEGMTHLGFNPEMAPLLGALSLICLVFYLIPRTAPLGAILFTGYFGGAIASQLRIGEPLFGYVLFPVYVAAIVWGGLYLRDARVRNLLRPPVSM